MDKDQALEEMMGKLGDFGRYQCFQFILHILSALTAGMHMLSLVTVAAVPDHRCWIEGFDTNMSTAAWNSPEILAAIPKRLTGELQSCYMYNANNKSVRCSKWVYDTKYRSSSRAIEWDLVCDKRWRVSLAHTISMFGVLTGAITLGAMADKYGRKFIFCLSGVSQLILGVMVAFIPEYWTFLVCRYLLGIFGSAGDSGFVLTFEIVGLSKRTPCGVAFSVFFALGIMLMAGWGALIDDRQILQVVYGLHGLLLIPHIWIMDESPRWLWAQGRVKESVGIVEKALKCNRFDETLDIAQLVSRGKVRASKGSEDAAIAGTADLFKTPNLRNRTLSVCFCWFASSIVYYGLYLNTEQMEGNPCVIIIVMAFGEIATYAAVIYLLDIWGRRLLISSMMFTSGLACIVAVLLPTGSIGSTAVVLVGKLFISRSFAIIYNYSAELFPTVVRNSAVGLGSMCARVSGALSPVMTLLVSFDPKIPVMIFGCIALLSGFLCFFLPETMNQPLPQSLEDGEAFGVGDTLFTSFLRKKRRNRSYSDDDKEADRMVPLEEMSKKV